MTQIPLIALVDDDEGMRRSLDGLVRSLGYRTASFGSAEAFLAAPETAEAACVISDIHMAGMNGVALARNVGPALWGRVILVSALASERERAEAGEAGVRYLLGKPFDPDQLIACIEAIVEV